MSSVLQTRASISSGHKYVWFVTQSVIGEGRNGVAPAKHQFPIGMLGRFWVILIETMMNWNISGVSFETSSAALIEQIPSALSVFAEAVEDFIKTYNVRNQVTKY